MEDLVTLKKFNTYIEAAGVVELLDKNNISYKIEKTENTGEVVFAGNTLDEELHVKVKPEDYEAAQQLLEELEEIDAEKLQKDYYLFEFTDKELIEILERPDEWSLNDYNWAQEILKQRGKEVAKSQLEDWKKKRLDFLSQPESVKSSYIRNAYLFCILGGIIGFFMGRHVHIFQKLLPNGQKVYAFDEKSRNKGKKVEMTGLVCFVIYFILLIVFVIS
jgi:hypothetical protein